MESNPFSLIVAIKFIDLLSTDFTEWEAFKLGLIDGHGKKIREPKGAEKKYFRSWYNLVRNLKRSLLTVPGGRSKFASYAAAFALLREEAGKDSKSVEYLTENLGRMEVAKDSRNLSPGTYVLIKGPFMEQLKEENKSLVFSVGKRVEPTYTPFGSVFRLIDNGRRIYACESHLVRL